MQYLLMAVATATCFIAANVQAQDPAVASGQMSSTCQFTQGPRAGQVQSYMGRTQPIPVGSPCTDGGQNSGTAVPD